MIEPFEIEINEPFKTKYAFEPEGVIVRIGCYAAKPEQPGIEVVSKYGEPILRATACLVDYQLDSYGESGPYIVLESAETWIKDYSENEGILAELIKHDIIRYENLDVTISFATHAVTFHKVKLILKALDLWEGAHAEAIRKSN